MDVQALDAGDIRFYQIATLGGWTISYQRKAEMRRGVSRFCRPFLAQPTDYQIVEMYCNMLPTFLGLAQ